MKRATPAVLVLLVTFLSAATVAQEQTASGIVKETYTPTHGWRSSTPEMQGMDSEVFAQIFEYVRQHQIPIHSLLIVRNGYVVLDAYFYPFGEGQEHDVASVTKSVTSTLIGIAIAEHKLSGVQQPVLSFFPERKFDNHDNRKDRITIENLLSMTSGLDCHVDHGEITLKEMMQSKDWVQFMLDRPIVAEPGSKFEYCSGGMHLLSGIISKATGTSALEFARSELFEPLGIEDLIWPSDPQGVSRGWGDLHLRPRDMAKIGYLWLNQGRWESRQIVPTDYMLAATQDTFASQLWQRRIWVWILGLSGKKSSPIRSTGARRTAYQCHPSQKYYRRVYRWGIRTGRYRKIHRRFDQVQPASPGESSGCHSLGGSGQCRCSAAGSTGDSDLQGHLRQEVHR